MATIWIKEFVGGLDTRRLDETTAGGVLIRATDGHITRGGEFEKRAAFAPEYNLPTGTVGLAATAAGVYVFGSGTTPTLPAGVSYQRLVHPDTVTPLARILSWDLYAGKIYVVAEFANASIHHYFDGTRVTAAPANADFARTIGSRMTLVSGPNAYGSKLNDATDYSGTGYFLIDMSTQSSGSEDLKALATYQNFVAVFAERAIQIWRFASDPASNAQQQVLRNTGTASPRSITGFGDNDVFYLDESGLRSLRARDSSNAAATSDIGVPIDPLIVAKLTAFTEAERRDIIGLIEPGDGRFWLCMKDEIFVFSFFPGAKVSAWTKYEPAYYDGDTRVPFDVAEAVVFGRRVHVRSGDKIFVYGGLAAETEYDATEAEAWTPYLDGNSPTTPKKFEGVDAALTGSWQVRVAYDPNNADASDKVAILFRTSYSGERIPLTGTSSHVSIRFKTTGSSAARLGAAVITYDSAKNAPNAG